MQLQKQVPSRPFLATWAVAYCARLIPMIAGLTSLALRIVTYWLFLVLGFSFLRVSLSATTRAEDKMSIREGTTVKAPKGLFTRPWFHLVWVVQETAAAREAILRCGRDSISWRDTRRACDQIERLVARTSIKNPYIDCQFRRWQGTRSISNPDKAARAKPQFG